MIFKFSRLLAFAIMALLFVASCKTPKATSSAPEKAPTETNWVQKLQDTPPVPAVRDNPNSLLWEISGNDLEVPSYLYGTIHLIGEADFIMTDLIKDRFSRTAQLTLEIDMDDPVGLLMAATGVFMNDGETLSSLLGEEDYERLSNYFRDTLDMDISFFNKMKPLLVSTMMTESTIEGPVTSYETVFMEMAGKADMEILGLETAAFQMSMFDSIPYAQQAEMLMEGLDGSGDMGQDLFETMVDLYKKQDLDGLYALITEESEDLGNFESLLLDKRNTNWIPVIERMSKEKPTFFAVGAAHLPGELGVIQLLKDAGFELTPLREIP
ncbi:MAG: TraB/GumN family protein [Bacteroidota bacterium]